MKFKEYYEFITGCLKKVMDTQQQNILKAADIITDSILGDGSLYVFGATHAGIITEELFYRAGGLMLVNPIFAPDLVTNVRPVSNTSKIENLSGYAGIIINGTDFSEKDALLVHSVSGRNIVSIEAAMECKKIGAKLIVLTNLSFSKKVKSRHPSGKRLFEINPDVTIDNCGIVGDATVEIKGIKQKVGSTSSVVGCFIANSIIIEVVQNLIDSNVTPPVFTSANLDNGNELNKKMIEKYKDRIKYL